METLEVSRACAMTYLYASIIRLYALGPGTLPRTHGHLAHAAFLDLVRQVDPALSQANWMYT